MDQINNFKESLRFVLKWEGSYVNNPSDPGGETKWGISKRAYPDEDIANLTPERASEIYARDYWDACGCDSIPYPLCVVVFDTAVNVGPGRAKDWLRKAPDANSYLTMRSTYYVNLVRSKPSMGQFLKGWLARVADLAKLVQIAQQTQDSNQKWGGLG